ncbi:DEKNAAC102985 [Brettanomyces naardenensis]|uniref:DEKNAAC102985 n=1 Tax=Brettanomyces naardenensis TaxID=13370 RepID=A0A448YLZ2_BRENA|nr:DEKNAAC102985 [Brettanomyces naardenensis]
MVLEDFEQDPNRISVAFVTYYYNLLNSNHNKLYQLYYKDAVLRHNSFKDPFAPPTETIVGIDDIKKHWAKSKLSGAKVMIQSIESTRSYKGSILIVAVGELALKQDKKRKDAEVESEPDADDDDEQASYKFVQTFILVPMEKRDVYDVYNDVLTFIPDVDYEYGEEDKEEEEEDDDDDEEESQEVEAVAVPEEDGVPEVQEKAKEEASEEVREDAKEEVSAEVQEEIEEESKEEVGEKANEEVKEEIHDEGIDEEEVDGAQVAEPKDESEASTTGKEVDSVSEITSVPSEEDGAAEKKAEAAAAVIAKPTKGLSWANQIASSGVKNTSIAKVPAQHVLVKRKTETSPGPVGAKKGLKKKDAKKHHHQDSDSDDGFEKVGGDGGKKGSRQNSGINRKGQTIYPIFIKSIDKDTSENVIINALESAFGRIDSFRIERTTAYVDFVDQDAQKKALATHVIKVGGSEIKLEPRIKKDTPSSNKKKNKKNGKRHSNGVNAGSGGSSSGLTEDGFKRVGKR